MKTVHIKMTSALTTALLLAVSAPNRALAHEAECPHCELDVAQDTPKQDNETAIQYGKKRIEYRCVMCAIADAEKSYKEDLTVLAPSEIKGKPVQIARTGGQWSAPGGTVFVGKKVKHRYCETGYRAFTSKAAFDAHVKKNKVLLKDAKPLTLAEMVKVSRADVGQDKK
jgi:hypothetical protein